MERKTMTGYSLYDYWFILYRRRKTLYLIVFFAMAFSAFLSWVLPETYEAKTVFFVPSKPDSLTFFSNGATAQSARTPLIPEPKGEFQKIYLGIFDSDTLRKKVKERFPEKTLRELKKDVDFHGSSNFLLEIFVRDHDPKQAAEIANTYVQYFNQMLNDYSLKMAVENRKSMEKEFLETQKKLTAARGALIGFQADNKISKVDEESVHLIGLRTDFQKSLEEAQVRAQEVTIKLATLQEQIGKESLVFGQSSIGMTSPMVENLERQLSDLEGRIASAKVNFGDSHPQIVSLRAEYEQKKKDLSKELDRITNSEIKSPSSFLEHLRQEIINLAVEKETLQARIKGLGKGIANVEGRVASLGKIQGQVQTLNKEVEQYQKLTETLQTSLEEATAQTNRNMESIIVIDKAFPPERAIFPNMILNLIVAMGMGLVGGVFYVYFIDYLDRLKLNLDEDIKELEKEYV
jgi:uncharacterized protein involved in exopolysaccharide biosynthesis